MNLYLYIAVYCYICCLHLNCLNTTKRIIIMCCIIKKEIYIYKDKEKERVAATFGRINDDNNNIPFVNIL